MCLLDENYKNINQFIFTTEHGTEQIALNEILKISSNSKLIEWLDHGIGIISITESYNSFLNKINGKNLIFVRHIYPVSEKIETSLDLEFIISTILKNLNLLDKNSSFSVQSRIMSRNLFTLKGFEINDAISNRLIEEGFILNITNPTQIISICITSTHEYIGFSLAKHNLSNWSGGKIRFLKDEKQISRSEFKLLEAFNVFDINIKKGGLALDLGASPGGWSKAISEMSMKVISVDPAPLSENLIKNKNILPIKATAQNFFKNNKEKFDIILNDMKMDINESIDIMILAKEFLKKDGFCIMTLKLPANNQQKKAYKAIEILEKHFKVLYARQLFYNRSEVTVVFGNIVKEI